MPPTMDPTFHDYDCSLVLGDDDCDCNLGDTRERWSQLMHLDNDSTRQRLSGYLADELEELTAVLEAFDRARHFANAKNGSVTS